MWDGLYTSPIPETNSATAPKQKNIRTEAALEATDILITGFIINKKTMGDFNYLPIINSVFYSFLGIVILLVCYLFIEKLTPEKTWHEISKNNNTALAIIFGAFIIGISIIISAAIHG